MKATTPPRVAVLGMGHELRGDDGAGLAIIRALKAQMPTKDNVLLLDTGASPEAFTGRLRQFAPDWVIFVDVAQMNAEGGSIFCLTDEAVDGLSASTHTLPISMMTKYLKAELGCQIALIGIQPVQTHFNSPLSAGVRQAVEMIVRTFTELT